MTADDLTIVTLRAFIGGPYRRTEFSLMKNTIVYLIFTLFLWPQAQAHAAQNIQSAVNEPEVRVAAGDLLEVRVFDEPELTQTVRVNRFGDASLLLIGTLHLADLSTDEARELIAQKFIEGHFLLKPQVSVLIREYSTQGVSVLGEVQKPGVYSVLGQRTLLDIISEAGGTTTRAGSSVTIKRASDGSIVELPLPKDGAATLTADVRLQPGDKVIIPRASLVYVLGDVWRPGGFLMQNGGHVTILQAMALAGGHTRTASLNRARLIHKTDAGYTDKEVPLKKIMNGQLDDFEIQAEDILYVPNSAVKSAFQGAVPAVLRSAATATVYGAID
jgi:polysaccharide export outer membrane protein